MKVRESYTREHQGEKEKVNSCLLLSNDNKQTIRPQAMVKETNQILEGSLSDTIEDPYPSGKFAISEQLLIYFIQCHIRHKRIYKRSNLYILGSKKCTFSKYDLYQLRRYH
jgi:hypothetical protein